MVSKSSPTGLTACASASTTRSRNGVTSSPKPASSRFDRPERYASAVSGRQIEQIRQLTQDARASLDLGSPICDGSVERHLPGKDLKHHVEPRLDQGTAR